MKDNPQQAELKWAYLAGLIDADGCISINKYPNARTYKVEVIIVQKKEEIPLWLMKNVCDSRKLDQVKRPKGYSNNCKYWRWSISGKLALDVLTKCVPYLIEKKIQAELSIELLQNKSPKNQRAMKGRVGNIGEKPEIVARQEEIYHLVKALKKPIVIPAVATTECVNPKEGSDSLNCIDGKDADVAEMTTRQAEVWS